MPLGSSNYRNVTEDVQEADDVLLSVRPSTVAMAEDWNTEIVRRPDSGGSPSTDQDTEVRVATRPAGQRVVVDRSVPSTTAKSWWRARHVRPGSTAGEWTDWKGGNPRDDADSAIHSSLNVAQLDVITNDIGKLTAGTLANTTGTRFINLSATGNNDFIHVEDASGTTTLSIQADGDADFGGTVSSSRLTASVVQQGSSNRNITLEALPIGPASTDSFITFENSTGVVSSITSSTRVFTLQNRVSGDFLRLASSTDTRLFSGRDVTIQSGGSDDIHLNPGGFVDFDGDNLSTSATTGTGPDRYLTVNTSAGLRKIPLFQT